MASGAYRGANRSAFYAGQQAGAGAFAGGQYRGEARKAFYAGQKSLVPATPAPTTPSTATNQPAATQDPQATQPTPQMRTYRDFLPSNIEASPLYQWRLQEGQKALDSQLAAQGLTGSGKQIKEAVGLTNQLSAEELDRATKLAQDEANRYERVTQNQADFAAGREDAQTGNLFRLASMYLDQNPMNYALQGTNQYANTLGQQGNNNANVRADNYRRVSGGARGPAPVYDPGYPSGPNYSQSNIIQAGNGYSNTRGWSNALSNFLGSLR